MKVKKHFYLKSCDKVFPTVKTFCPNTHLKVYYNKVIVI